MRSILAFTMSTLPNSSTKIVLLIERRKFWFNISKSKQMTLVNTSATDSKGYFFLLAKEKMHERFCSLKNVCIQNIY